MEVHFVKVSLEQFRTAIEIRFQDIYYSVQKYSYIVPDRDII